MSGAHTLSTRVGARLPPWARPCLVGPLLLHRPQLQLHIFTFEEKKSERRIHRVLRYGAAVTTCSSSGGHMWSPFRAPERGNRRHHHHQHSSITNFKMLIAVRE